MNRNKILGMGTLLVLVFLLLGCTANVAMRGPGASPDLASLSGISPPDAAAPQGVQGQSFWGGPFGSTDVTGLWVGWLKFYGSDAESAQFSIDWYRPWDSNWNRDLDLDGELYLGPERRWYETAEGRCRGDTLWMIFNYNLQGPQALGAKLDDSRSYTQECGLYFWDEQSHLWRQAASCYLKRVGPPISEGSE
jgi:hypothetical protein